MNHEQIKRKLENVAILIGVVAAVVAGIGLVLPEGKMIAAGCALSVGVIGAMIQQVVAAGAMRSLQQDFDQKAEQAQKNVVKTRTEAMSTAQAQKSTTERLERLTLIAEMLKAVATSRDLSTLLESILSKTMKVVGARSGFVSLLNEESSMLEVKHGAAAPGEPVPSGRIPLGEGLIGQVAANNKPRMMNPASVPGGAEPRDRRKKSPSGEPSGEGQTLIAVPLTIADRVIGVLTLEDAIEDEFHESDLELLTLVGQEVAIAIEKAQLYQRMETMSITDGLTGLANRRYLDQRLSDDTRRARRYHLPLALTIFDLDNFKSVNDTYGHAAGDALLRAFAEILKSNVRDTDLTARYGGEEFVILAPDCTDAQANAVAERIRRVVSETDFDVGTAKTFRTCSAGVASIPLDGGDVATLIKAADAALYYAKENGRNRVVLHQELLREPVIDSTADEPNQAELATV